MKTALVVNPRSADGDTGRRWELLRKQIDAHLEIDEELFTRGVGDGTIRTREALRSGYDRVVAVGGDGTTNEVVNGFFDEEGEPLRPGSVLGVLPHGTGCDFARFLGLPRDIEEAARLLASSDPWPLDVGRLEATGPNGDLVRSYFVNITDFEIGGMVSARVNRSSKRFGGFFSFLWHSLIAFFVYRPQEIELVVDGDDQLAGRFQNVVVANGRFFGGGMNIAPQARADDGLFDLILLRDVGLWDTLRHLPKLYQEAGVLGLSGVEARRARRVEARGASGAEDVWIDMDGENPGRLPLTIEVVPRVLRLQAPRPEPVAAAEAAVST